MPFGGDSSILVPVEVSNDGPSAQSLIDLCGSVDVVLLGYYPVPDQAAPAQLRQDHNSDANATLAKIADEFRASDSGPHAPVGARRAADFATVSDTVAILLNVQQRAEDEQTNHVKHGRETVRSVAERSGLDIEEYDSALVVATDVESAIIQGSRSMTRSVWGCRRRVTSPGRCLVLSPSESAKTYRGTLPSFGVPKLSTSRSLTRPNCPTKQLPSRRCGVKSGRG